MGTGSKKTLSSRLPSSIESENNITSILDDKKLTPVHSTSFRALDARDPQLGKEYAFGKMVYAQDKKSKQNNQLLIELLAINPDESETKKSLKLEHRRKFLRRLIEYGVIEGNTPLEKMIGLIGRERAKLGKRQAKGKLKDNEESYLKALIMLQRKLDNLKISETNMIRATGDDKDTLIKALLNSASKSVFTALTKFDLNKSSEKLFQSICDIHSEGSNEYPSLKKEDELDLEKLQGGDSVVISKLMVKDPIDDIKELIRGYKKNIVETSKDLDIISDLRKEEITSGLDLIGNPKKNPNAPATQESIEHKIGRIYFSKIKQWWPYSTQQQYIEIDKDDGSDQGKSNERIRFLRALKKYGIVKGNTLVSSVNALVGEYLRDLYIREGVTDLSEVSKQKQILAIKLQEDLQELEIIERKILPNDFESRESLRSKVLNLLDKYALGNDLLSTHMLNTGGKFNITLFDAKNIASRHLFPTHQPTLHDQGIFYEDSDKTKPIILSTEDHKISSGDLQGFIKAYSTDARSEAAKVTNPISRWWYQINDAIGYPLGRPETKSAFSHGYQNEAQLIDQTFSKHTDSIPKRLIKNTTFLIGYPFLYTFESLRGVYQDLKNQYTSFKDINEEKEHIGLQELIRQTKPDDGKTINAVDVRDINAIHALGQQSIDSHRLIPDHRTPNIFQRTDFISNTLRPVESSFNAIQTGFIANPVITSALLAVGALSVTGILIPYQFSHFMNLMNKGEAPRVLRAVNNHFKMLRHEGFFGKVIAGIDEAKLAFLFSSIAKKTGPYDAISYWSNVATDPLDLIDQTLNIAYMHASAQQKQSQEHITLVKRINKISERRSHLDAAKKAAPDTTTIRSILGFVLEFIVTPVRFIAASILSIKRGNMKPLRRELDRLGRNLILAAHGFFDLINETLRFSWSFITNAIRFAVSAVFKIPAVIIGTVGYVFDKVGDFFNYIHLKPIGYLFKGLGKGLTFITKGLQYARNQTIHYFDKYINNPVKQQIFNRVSDLLLKIFNPLHPENVIKEKIKLIGLTEAAYTESAANKAKDIRKYLKDSANPSEVRTPDPAYDLLMEAYKHIIQYYTKPIDPPKNHNHKEALRELDKLSGIHVLLNQLKVEQTKCMAQLSAGSKTQRNEYLKQMKSIERKSNSLQNLSYLIQYHLKVKELNAIGVELTAMLQPKFYKVGKDSNLESTVDSSPHLVNIACVSGDISKLLLDAEVTVSGTKKEAFLNAKAKAADGLNEGYVGPKRRKELSQRDDLGMLISPEVNPDLETDYSLLPPLSPESLKGNKK